ncbi:MAG: Serine/threonine-protein kinase C [Pseudidiomarina mangrovi]|nr:MAG: Serine/threonine-protein kinase C [Pseudidiomarina mangrovi]
MTTSNQGIALPVGTEINHYRIADVLGQGGFGVVYKAHHTHLDEQVVIKEFLPVELAGRHGNTVSPHSNSKQDLYSDCLRRFMEEGRTLVKLRHPNVVRCRDLFTANGTAYLVMDFEDGLSLDQLIRALEQQNDSYTQVQLLHFLIPLAQGLAYIHDQGVLHRDIKPGNVFIRRHDGSPVIIDFGAAKQNFAIASQSQAPFTEFYAPLEQIEGGGEAKPTIDIHAFGALVYRLVSGAVGPKAEARAMALLYGSKDPLSPVAEVTKTKLTDAFCQLIDSCLAFRAGDRPQSMHEIVTALEQIAGKSLSGDSAKYTKMPAAEKPAKAEKPKKPAKAVDDSKPAMIFPTKWVAIIVAVAVLGGGGAWAISEFQQQRAIDIEQQRIAEQQRKQDEAAWGEANSGNTIEDFEQYIANYPEGIYLEAAKSRKKALELEAELQRKLAEQEQRDKAERDRLLAEQRERERIAEQQRKAEEQRRKAARARELAGEMVSIRGGSFSIGCDAGSSCDSKELPTKQISIKAFQIGKYEVTRAQFAAFVRATNYVTRAERETGSATCYAGVAGRDPFWAYTNDITWRNASLMGSGQGDNHPVVCVSQLDALEFIDWLNKETGMKFRLPSEAEWEYVARAGSRNTYGVTNNQESLCMYGNVNDSTALPDGTFWNSKLSCTDGYAFTAPVGSYIANAFGVHDIIGNVKEFTADCWNANLSNIPSNGSANKNGDCTKVVERGGNFNTSPSFLRVTYRGDPGNAFRGVHAGFRLALDN